MHVCKGWRPPPARLGLLELDRCVGANTGTGPQIRYRYNLTYMHVPVGMFQACGHAGNKACLPYVICTYDLSVPVLQWIGNRHCCHCKPQAANGRGNMGEWRPCVSIQIPVNILYGTFVPKCCAVALATGSGAQLCRIESSGYKQWRVQTGMGDRMRIESPGVHIANS